MKSYPLVITLLLLIGTATGVQAQDKTTKPKSSTTPTKSSKAATPAKPVVVPANIEALLRKNTCLACHKADAKLVGPAYVDVAKRKYTNEQIVELIYEPKPEHWPGYPPMAPMKQVPKEEALKIAAWINSLAKK